jgi:hypothetical protein
MPARQRDRRDGTTRVRHKSERSSCVRGQPDRPAPCRLSWRSPSENPRRQDASRPVRRLFRTQPQAGDIWRSERLRRTPDARERAAVPVLHDGKPEVISTKNGKIATFAPYSWSPTARWAPRHDEVGDEQYSEGTAHRRARLQISFQSPTTGVTLSSPTRPGLPQWPPEPASHRGLSGRPRKFVDARGLC